MAVEIVDSVGVVRRALHTFEGQHLLRRGRDEFVLAIGFHNGAEVALGGGLSHARSQE